VSDSVTAPSKKLVGVTFSVTAD